MLVRRRDQLDGQSDFNGRKRGSNLPDVGEYFYFRKGGISGRIRGGDVVGLKKGGTQ